MEMKDAFRDDSHGHLKELTVSGRRQLRKGTIKVHCEKCSGKASMGVMVNLSRWGGVRKDVPGAGSNI